ncbi:MAG: hypothetical protein AAF310_00980 [Myxococcota bacterium]
MRRSKIGFGTVLLSALCAVAWVACTKSDPQQQQLSAQQPQWERVVRNINFIDNNYPQHAHTQDQPVVVKDVNQISITIGFDVFVTQTTTATNCYVDILKMQQGKLSASDRVQLPAKAEFAACSRRERIFASYVSFEFHNTICGFRDKLRIEPQKGEKVAQDVLQSLQSFQQAAQRDDQLTKQRCSAVAKLLQQVAVAENGIAGLLQ